ncbi:hypothetical protein C8Q78DRAFT_1049132 [Trametes maxima]|nr:hypothetical protein C8Q78DRAFT_1049132 [Trametes maxima]
MASMSSSTCSASEGLRELRIILENLPKSLPEPESSRFLGLEGFVADPEDVDWIGSVEGAANLALERAFGAEARSKGVLVIEERGRAVCGLIDALQTYYNACSKPESDAILLKWIHDIRAGAEQAYKRANQKVSRLKAPKIIIKTCLLTTPKFPPSISEISATRCLMSAVQSELGGDSGPESGLVSYNQVGAGTVAGSNQHVGNGTTRKRKASTSLEVFTFVLLKDQPSRVAGIKLSDLVDIPWRAQKANTVGRPVNGVALHRGGLHLSPGRTTTVRTCSQAFHGLPGTGDRSETSGG